MHTFALLHTTHFVSARAVQSLSLCPNLHTLKTGVRSASEGEQQQVSTARVLSHYRENSSATHSPTAQQPSRWSGNNNRLRTPVQPQFTIDRHTCHHPAVTATLTRSLATVPPPAPPLSLSLSRRCVSTQFFLPSHAQYKVPLRWLKNQRISFGVFFLGITLVIFCSWQINSNVSCRGIFCVV